MVSKRLRFIIFFGMACLLLLARLFGFQPAKG